MIRCGANWIELCAETEGAAPRSFLKVGADLTGRLTVTTGASPFAASAAEVATLAAGLRALSRHARRIEQNVYPGPQGITDA